MSDELHPVGLYDATVVECYFCRSRTSGLPQVLVKVETQHGRLIEYLALSQKAAPFTVEKLQNMGFKGNDLAALGKTISLVGNKCKVEVIHKTYNGVVEARIDWIRPVDYGGSDKGDESVAAEARQFNHYLTRRQPAGQPKQAPSTAPAPENDFEVANDQVPF